MREVVRTHGREGDECGGQRGHQVGLQGGCGQHRNERGAHQAVVKEAGEAGVRRPGQHGGGAPLESAVEAILVERVRGVAGLLGLPNEELR